MGSSNYLGDQHTHSCSPMPDCSVFLALRKQLLYGKMTQPKETTDIVFGDRNVANGAIACSVNATAITSAGGLCNEVQPKLCLVLMDATISTCGLHPACQPYMKYNLSSRCSSHRARSGIPFVGATRFRTNTYSRKVHQGCLASQALLVVPTGTKLTTTAQAVWTNFVHSSDTVVDATAGNGGDTLWLAKAVGPGGTVYVFDKQGSAITATQQKLADELAGDAMPTMVYRESCHSLMLDSVAPSSASLICFNLGYLPSSAHSKALTATSVDSTVAAIDAAVKIVKSGGLISVMAYIGHPGGPEEYEAVRQYMQSLPTAKYTCSQYKVLNRLTAPLIMLIHAK